MDTLPPLASGRSLGTLDYGLLPEASGMAISRRTENRLWLINDAGNSADLVAADLNPQGQDYAFRSISVTGARNGDWEDLDGFEKDGRAYLIIGDIGDNLARRDHVALHFVAEPESDATATATAETLKLEYPDGARDAESLAVDVAGDRIYILSKRDTPPVLYAYPLSKALQQVGNTETVTLRRLGEITSIPAPTKLELRLFPRYGRYRNQPTGMSLSPDGSTIVLLTYGDAYRVLLDKDRDWLNSLNGALESVGMPFLAQPESIAIDAEQTIFLSSERENAPLLAFPASPQPPAPASER